MATNLNKTNRAEIIESVIRATDLGKQRTEILEAARAVARTTIKNWLPAEFNAAVEATGHPEWFPQWTCMWAGVETHPNGVLNGGDFIQLDPLPVMASDVNAYAIRPAVVDALAPLTQQAKTLVENEKKIRTDLMAYLLSCKTVEAAVKGMPELRPHVPAAAKPAFALVAPSNVLTDLMAVGFKTEA